MADALAADIEFRHVTKRFGGVTAVGDLDLRVPRGAFLALLGPSGCGKTTCLRMIGGFEQPTSGEVLIRGQTMAGVPPYRRPVNLVFQHYALFPHLDVAHNVGYGLRQIRPRLTGGEIARRVDEALALVRLDGYGRRRVHELSGGQQQRVALARALINKPAVLLLDEPLAALDRKLRVAMQMELQGLQKELGITFVLVTHDQEEALSMSDLVCVMNGGRIIQVAPPQQVYDEPADLFVADFVGKTNRLSGTLDRLDGGMGDIVLADGARHRGRAPARVAAPLAVGAAAVLTIRPEALTLHRGTEAVSVPSLTGIVTNRIFLGSTAEYAIRVPGLGDLFATTDHRQRQGDDLIAPGETVSMTFDPAAALLFADGAVQA